MKLIKAFFTERSQAIYAEEKLLVLNSNRPTKSHLVDEKGDRKATMISVTRFNGTKFYLNAEQIMLVEGTPDTVITLLNNVKMVVKENPSVVVGRIIEYQQTVHNPQFKNNIGE